MGHTHTHTRRCSRHHLHSFLCSENLNEPKLQLLALPSPATPAPYWLFFQAYSSVWHCSVLQPPTAQDWVWWCSNSGVGTSIRSIHWQNWFVIQSIRKTVSWATSKTAAVLEIDFYLFVRALRVDVQFTLESEYSDSKNPVGCPNFLSFLLLRNPLLTHKIFFFLLNDLSNPTFILFCKTFRCLVPLCFFLSCYS